jgi:hypothetical protein
MIVVIAVAAAAGGYYWFDVWRRPSVPCRPCNGSGANFSRLGGGVFRRPFGRCWCCKGRKSHTRFAARILTPGQYRAIQAKKTGRNF